MRPTVHIRRDALETLISASIETFKRECFGFVFGHAPTRLCPHFTITSATPLQMPKKLHTGIEEHTRSERRLKKFFAMMPHRSRPLGNFHSHTEWGKNRYRGTMSTTDILSMIRERVKIEFIIAVSSRKKVRTPWKTHRDGSMRGSFGSKSYKYHFTINAYILEWRNNEPIPVRLRIRASEAAEAFNRALGYSS